MISNCRPVGPTNLHITSSTVAVCTWNRSWSLGKVDSITLISCFNTFRQAIIDRALTPQNTRRSLGNGQRTADAHSTLEPDGPRLARGWRGGRDGAKIVTFVPAATDHVRVEPLAQDASTCDGVRAGKTPDRVSVAYRVSYGKGAQGSQRTGRVPALRLAGRFVDGEFDDTDRGNAARRRRARCS